MMTTVTPPTHQFFYIASQAEELEGLKHPQEQPFVFGFEADDPGPGTPIILRPMEGSDARSQLWCMTGDGRLISGLNGYAIAWDDSQNRITTAVAGDRAHPHQFWSVTGDGRIANRANGGVLTTLARTNGRFGAALSPEADDAWRLQHWTLLAPPVSGSTTAPSWVCFQSALPDTGGADCLISVDANSTDPGAVLIIWPYTQQTAAASQLWQITPDGRILSAQGDNLVLTLGGPSDGDGGNYVTVDTQRDPLPLTQVWDLSTPNQIRSASSGDFLCPSGGTGGPVTHDAGDPVVAAPGTPSASYTWYTTPATPLQAILQQTPEDFPEFTDDKETAYTCIEGRLGVPSLRATYVDLSADIDSYSSQIGSWNQAPDGISQGDWDAVRSQLLTEISYAGNTRSLFDYYAIFQNSLFGTDSDALNAYIKAAGLTVGSDQENVAGIILAILGGVAYTAMSAQSATPGWPVLGNLMETGINIGLAASSGGGSISPDPFQVTVVDLWTELDNNYKGLLGAMGTIEIAILQDWGMLQSVYPLTLDPDRPDTLYWDPETAADLIAAATPGYDVSMMQMLLAAKYQIYVAETTDPDYYPSDLPSWAMWQSGGWTYWIAEITNAEVFPAELTMQSYVWGYGVRPEQFFRSGGGWAFATNSQVYDGWLTFTNLTPDLLRLSGPTGDSYLGAYQSCGVGLNSGSYGFQVTDLNGSQGSNQVAQFTAEVHSPFFGSPTISVTSPSSGTGYRLTSPLCTPTNGGNYGGYAAAQIGLAMVPM